MGRINEHGQSELALAELHWKSLSERRTPFIARQMYKITHDLALKQLHDIFHETPSFRHYNLRGFFTKLYLPQPNTDYLRKSLSFRGGNTSKYADACTQATTSHMQEVLEAMQTWATENKMTINPKQTKDMWICFSSALSEPAPLVKADGTIERVSAHNLVGVWPLATG